MNRSEEGMENIGDGILSRPISSPVERMPSRNGNERLQFTPLRREIFFAFLPNPNDPFSGLFADRRMELGHPSQGFPGQAHPSFLKGFHR
jgi:hypothetical protein